MKILGLGPVMILGSFLGRGIVSRMTEKLFAALIAIVLTGAGSRF